MDARPVAVHDANVLYPAHLRDLVMRLAMIDLVRPHWSNEIHDEWMRNVHADHPDVTWEDLEYPRREMDRARPDACVDGFQERIETRSHNKKPTLSGAEGGLRARENIKSCQSRVQPMSKIGV